MRKTFVVLMILSTILASACGMFASPTLTPVQLVNIEIIGDMAKIYSEKSPDSEFLAGCSINDVFHIINTEVDSKGNTWYQVQRFVDSIGWVEGKYCKKTNNPVTGECQTAGKLLDPEIDKDILLKLLTIDYSSVDGFIKEFGKDYKKTITDIESFEIEYKYPNGFAFYSSDAESIYRVTYQDNTYIYSSFNGNKKIIGNVSESPGNEILYIYNDTYLLILQEGTNNIIGNYEFNNNSLGDVMTVNFLNEGTDQIFINEQAHSVDDRRWFFDSERHDMLFSQGSTKNGLYKLNADNRLVKVLGSNDFSSYAKGIKSSITNNNLVLDIQVGSYNFKQSDPLPEHVFYNRKNFPDHNEALSTVIDWNIELINKKYYAVVDIYVVFDMLNATWGLPEPDGDDFGVLPNDLSRTRIVIDYNNKMQKIISVDTLVKYENPAFTKIKRPKCKDLKIQKGPAIGQDFIEAYSMLSDKLKIHENEDTAFFNGVTISRNWNDNKTVDQIYVNSPEYLTSGGIKVGDSEDKVIEVYGMADQGLPGDEYADYYSIYDFEGHLGFASIFGLTFRYKDKKVVSYHIYSYTLD